MYISKPCWIIPHRLLGQSLPGPGYFDCTIKRLFSPYGATPQPGSLQHLWVIIIMSAESADNQAISPPASIVLLYTLPKKIQPNPPTRTRYRMEGVVTRHLGKRVAGGCDGPHLSQGVPGVCSLSIMVHATRGKLKC